MKLVMRSWATAPEAATIRPLTVPSTVAKAIADITANRNTPNVFARRGAAMLLLSTSRTPLTMCTDSHIECKYVEKPDSADSNNC